MSIRNLILSINSVTVSYFTHYDSLLQNATGIITKSDSYFITKCGKSLLQNASGFLLQNATVITNCDSIHKKTLLLRSFILIPTERPWLPLKNDTRCF